MDDLAALKALAALAQPSRLEAFRLLVRNEPNGLAAGAIARLIGTPQNTMSAHLGILQRTGLVTAERQGRRIQYRADLDCLRALMLFLVKDCCGARADLTRPLVADLLPCC